MERAGRDAVMRRTTTPMLLVSAVLVVWMSWWPGSPLDATTVVSLAVVALLLSMLLGLADRVMVLGAGPVAVGSSRARDAAALRAGRPTDPTHHPLRPRAPGTA